MDAVKVVGVTNVSFTTKDGTQISGKKLYYTEPIPASKGVGESADSVFVSDNKLSGMSITPGCTCEILYNKYGKVANVKVTDAPLEFGDID